MHLITTFSLLSIKEELAISCQCLEVLSLPSALYSGWMTQWRHIPSLSVEWESEKLIHPRCLIWTGLKTDERNLRFADSLLSVCSVCTFLCCLQAFGWVCFFIWDKCFCYKQLERHLDKSLIMPTLNQDGLKTREAASTLKFRRLCEPFFGHYQYCQHSLSATTTRNTHRKTQSSTMQILLLV